VKDAQRAVREQVNFLPGMYVTWSGQFEYLERAIDKLALVVPLTLAIIFVLLYLSLKSFATRRSSCCRSRFPSSAALVPVAWTTT